MSPSKKRKYKPEFAGPVEGYAVNYITKNAWKVQSSMEHCDLRQEAYIVFAAVRDRYPGVEAPHFMALFKTSWHRHFLDLANADTARRACIVPLFADRDGDEDGESSYAARRNDRAGETDNNGALLVMIRQAPQEIMLVVNLFLSAPAELLELALGSWGSTEAQKNTSSARINRLVGIDPSYDSLGAVRTYFSERAV